MSSIGAWPCLFKCVQSTCISLQLGKVISQEAHCAIISCLSFCCEKIPDNESSKQEGFILAPSSRGGYMVGRKLWRQDLETGGQLAPTVLQQREIDAST